MIALVIVPPEGVPKRIRNQIFDGLFDPIGIGNNLIRQRVDVDANRHRLRVRCPFVPLSHIVQEPLDMEPPSLQHNGAVFVTARSSRSPEPHSCVRRSNHS